MKNKASILLVFLLLVALIAADGPVALGASPPDFAIPGGHFYTQASGSPDPAKGFSITDGQGIPFRTELQAQGGIAALGYPSSRRFVLDGFLSQATQKAILQWRPQESLVVLANVFDTLHDRGFDPWLLANRQIPPPFDTSPDTGLSFEQVVRRHLDFLDVSQAIRDRYLTDSNPLAHFGLPMSSADLGPVIVVRAQRAAFQEWKLDVPWAKAGTVTIANAGDIAKEAGLIFAGAAAPEDPPAATTLSPKDVEARAKPSVVKVTLPGVEGSGIVFDPSGFIVTNNHVVQSGGPVQVSTSKGGFPARVVGADPLTDLAVLKVDGASLPALPFGDSDALALGDEVVAIGFSPLLPNPPNSYEAEVLRLVQAVIPVDGRRADFVQTNAPLHPGDSGGPLLNLFGEVVGVNTALIFPRRGSQTVLASSIAINRAKPILAELLAKGKVARPGIGATVHAIVPGFTGGQELPVDRGLVVLNVVPGSPAAQAGMSEGEIIVAADGFGLTLPSDLLQVISGHKVGDTMRLTVVGADGSERNVEVTLAEMP